MLQSQSTNLFSEEFLSQPYPYLKQFRQEPLAKNNFIGSWVISRYEDVLEVLNNPRIFSSNFRVKSQNLQEFRRIVSVPSLLSLDPPEHTRLKRLISPLFMKNSLKEFTLSVQKTSSKFCNNLIQKQEVDFIKDFAVPIPIEIISKLLQFPVEDIEDLKRWSFNLISIASADLIPDKKKKQEKINSLLPEVRNFHKYLQEKIQQKEQNSGDDLISKLIAVKDQDGTLSSEEVLRLIELLLITSHETTTTSITSCLLCLLKYPEYWQLLKNDKTLIPFFIEEALRFTSPVIGLFRQATQDTTIGDTKISKQDRVYLSLASANHDEKNFCEPETFNIHRNNKHIAFGHGVHFCLGAHLAREELRIIMEDILTKISSIELLDENISWKTNLLIRVPSELYIKTT